MKKYIIIPDVTCELNKQMREYFGLKDYVHGYVHIGDRAIKTSLEWDEISREEFYKTLANKKISVTSAVASPEEFYSVFKKYVDEGYDVLSMSISSKISATYSVTVTAAARINEECGQKRVYTFDSLRMSGSLGLLVGYACEMQAQGKSLEEVLAWLEENKVRVHQMGPIDDLTFIARRGKISKGKAFMGNLVGIKPMGDSNAEGYVTVLAKVKGIKKALDATVAYMKKTAENIEKQYIFVMHSDREAYAAALKERIEREVPCKKVFIGDVYPACGTNIGPGMISVYFMGAPISADCAAEKAALEQAIAEN